MISGTVKSCMLKEHGKSAKLELNERDTAYTLFDLKFVPALQPGTTCHFEVAQREFKETKFWVVVDGTMSLSGAAVGATRPEDEYDAFERSEARAVEHFKAPPPIVEGQDILLDRIACALERIADYVQRK